MSPIRVAIITISDTAALDASADKSGPAIRKKFDGRPGFDCVRQLIVPDELLVIQEAVQRCAEQGDVDLVVTTGGTGFGMRDCTPEAIEPLLDRKASGLVHFLQSESLRHTPLAALSRPVAGTIEQTLVVTLPGSVKAVNENLETLFHPNLLDHAIDLIKGGTGQEVHTELAKASCEDGVGRHECHHHRQHHPAPENRTLLSHDPLAPISTRHRSSPYPLISLEEALTLIEKITKPLPVEIRTVDSNLRGYALAADVRALRHVPQTHTTNVDGYALRASDMRGIYKVHTARSHNLSLPLPSGTIYRINTGDSLPMGTDAVIMVENTRLVSTFTGEEENTPEGEEKEIEILVQSSIGENVREPGSDVRKDDLALRKSDVIRSTGGDIGALIFAGRHNVEVYRKPIVALLSTGNEIVDISSSSTVGTLDTNRPSLQAALQSMGYQVIDLGIVSDDVDSLTSSIRRGVEEADAIITTGGTSMGPADLLKSVIEHQFMGIIHFGRVTIKPGKPTTFATIPSQGLGGDVQKPVFALPGNPASALVTFYIFVLPALRLLGGWPKSSIHLPRVRVELQSPMKLDPRLEFHRVIIKSAATGLIAFSTGGQRSSRPASLSGANGLVILPQKTTDSPPQLERGTMVDAVVIGEILGLS